MKIRIIKLPQPGVIPISKEVWELIFLWRARIKVGQTILRITAEPEFRYDGATIPRIAWSLIGVHPGGISLGPALSHDILYMTKGGRKEIARTYVSGKPCSRRTADGILYSAFIRAGVKKHRAALMYLAVRIGGRKYWGTKKPPE